MDSPEQRLLPVSDKIQRVNKAGKVDRCPGPYSKGKDTVRALIQSIDHNNKVSAPHAPLQIFALVF